MVDYIQEDSLADYTGLKAGDIILEVNNKSRLKTSRRIVY
ncbi:PDZ domain-containing protein [Bacillus licheniformis]|nr:PDZ domain-containing protein [Bacillus licheniformis]